MTETSRLLPERSKMERKISGDERIRKEYREIENCKLKIENCKLKSGGATESRPICNFQFSILNFQSPPCSKDRAFSQTRHPTRRHVAASA